MQESMRELRCVGMRQVIYLSAQQISAALDAPCLVQNADGEYPGLMESIPGASAPALELSPANSGVQLLEMPHASSAAVTPAAQSAAQDAANASAAAVVDLSDRLASSERSSNQPRVSGRDGRDAHIERKQAGLLDAESRAGLVEALATFAGRTELASRAARQGARDARDGQSASLTDEGANVVPGRSAEAAGSSMMHAEPGEQDSAASSSDTAPHTLGSIDSLSSRDGPLPEMHGASDGAHTAIPEELEMVGMPLPHDMAASSESPRQSVEAVPRRASAGAPTERPTFSLTAYGAGLPASQRTSPVGNRR